MHQSRSKKRIKGRLPTRWDEGVRTWINLPKRELLSLRTVLALPKASRMVLASRICCSTQVVTLEVTEHRYCRMNFVVSVYLTALEMANLSLIPSCARNTMAVYCIYFPCRPYSTSPYLARAALAADDA